MPAIEITDTNHTYCINRMSAWIKKALELENSKALTKSANAMFQIHYHHHHSFIHYSH